MALKKLHNFWSICHIAFRGILKNININAESGSLVFSFYIEKILLWIGYCLIKKLLVLIKIESNFNPSKMQRL